MAPQNLEEFEPEEILIDDTLNQEIPEARPDKRRKMENTRVQQLGSDPKKVRSESRSNLVLLVHVQSGTTCPSPARRIRSYCTGSAPVSVCPASTTRGSSTLEEKCRQRARSSRCVVSARKQGLWTKLKEVRVRLRPRRLQTKTDPTGLARQSKSSCVTVQLEFRSWSPNWCRKTVVPLPLLAQGKGWLASRGRGKATFFPSLSLRKRFVCFPRGKQMNRLWQFLYGVPTYVYGGSSSSQLFLARLCPFLFSSSASSARWPSKFVSKLSFSPDEIEEAEQLEPALESLLHSLKVHVIMAMTVNESSGPRVIHRLCTGRTATLKSAARRLASIRSEDAEFSHQREMDKLIGAWRQSKTQSDVKQAADAAAKAQFPRAPHEPRGDSRHGLEQSHGEVPTEIQSRPL